MPLGTDISRRVREAWNVLVRPVREGDFRFSPNLDSRRTALTPKLTFEKLNKILSNGDDGALTEALELFNEMESRDGRLKSVSQKRRIGLTKLDYEIVSAAEAGAKVTQGQADREADYVRQTLAEIDSFPIALEHLATAIGPNLAVLETLWDLETWTPTGWAEIPSNRLTMDLSRSPNIRVITDQNLLGVEATGPQWVVHIPHATSGSPLLKSLSTAQAAVWLIKKLAIADWATFCEVFGMPVRVGKYRPAASPEEKRVLRQMLEKIGSAAWAMVSEATSIEFAESSQRGVSPFQAVIEYCDREQAILWLGGNLGTDSTGGTGTFSTAKVQDEVADDLRDDDVRRESRTVTEQIVRPMVTFKFPGRKGPVPIFRRIKPETVDRVKEAQAIKAAQSAGVKIAKTWAHKRLMIPMPKPDEQVLEPMDAFFEGVPATRDPLDGK